MSRKSKAAGVDRDLLLADLQSPYELVRGKAVSSLCPCRSGWELFQQHVHIVSRLTKDSSPSVRAMALHVIQDAALIQSIGDAEHRFQSVEDVLRKKHGPRLQGEEAVMVRRSGRYKRRKDTFVLR